MPTLKDLVCHVQWTDTGSPFPEYGTQYGDGVVETYIAIPNHPQTFNVRLTSERFIFEGLVMVVFIDGNYQCNRVRVNLQPHKKGLPENRSNIDFVVRQKEKPLGDGTFVGREWRFDDCNIVPQLPAGVSESHFEELGTIEVLVLRCRSNNPNEFEISSDSSGEDSAILEGKNHEDQAESDSVDFKSAKTSQYQPEPETEFGALGGIFDGAADPPPFSQVSHGDAPADGYPPWRYMPHESSRYPQAHFPGPVLEDTYQYPRRPVPPPRAPVEYDRPRPERHVHFDYGDGRRLDTGYEDHHPRRRFEPADEYQRHDHYTGRNPYADYPPHRAERHYEYGGGLRDYDDYPATYQDYARYRPRSPGPDFYPAGPPPSFPSVPGLSNPRSAPSHPGMGSFAPIARRPGANIPTVWPNVHPQSVPQPFPVWIPPPAVAIPPPYPGTIPIYPPPGNAPLFHTQNHGYPLGTQNIAPTAGVAPVQNYNQQNAGSTLPQGSLASQQATHSFANPAPVVPNNSTGVGAWANNTGGANPQHNTSVGNGGVNTGNNDGRGVPDNNVQTNTQENKSRDAGNSSNDQTWKSNNNNDTTNNADDWGGKPATPIQGQGRENNTDDAGNGTSTQDHQNQGSGWDNNSANNDTGANQGSGWDTNSANNNTWANQGQDNNTTENDKPGEGWGNVSTSNTKEAPKQAVSKSSKTALYGPHGPYQAPRFLANTDVPIVAEEEPRYDVPQAVAQAHGTSKQVQPGRGYLYSKKSCHPEYVDSLDKPYARFVFKYRTKDQVKKETGIDVTVEPTGNEDVNALAALNKEELIQIVIRAKGALKGAIPDAPAKTSTPAPVQAFEPVPLPAPEHDYLKYKLPTGRQGSGLVGLGIRFPNSGSGARGASNSNNNGSSGDNNNGSSGNNNNNWSSGDNNNWSNGDNNNWQAGGDSNQQASNGGNNQSWAAEAPGWNDGGTREWDGPEEADNAVKQKDQGQSQKRPRDDSDRVSVESSKTTIDHRPKLDPRRPGSGISPKDKSGLSKTSPQPAVWQNPFGPSAPVPFQVKTSIFGIQAPAKPLSDTIGLTTQPRTGPYADYTGPGAPNQFGIPNLPPDSAYAMPGPSNSGKIWDSYFTQPLETYTSALDYAKPNAATGANSHGQGTTAADPLNPYGITGPGPRPPSPGPDVYIPPLSPSPDPNEYR